MTHPTSKMAAALAVVIALLGTSSAFATDTTEFAASSAAASTAASAQSETRAVNGIILAGNQQATNLQKTSTAIMVSGIARDSKRRLNR